LRFFDWGARSYGVEIGSVDFKLALASNGRRIERIS